MTDKRTIKYILFDAANTLIYKPSLWDKMQEVLQANNIHISTTSLKYNHKVLSELIEFPDRTSEEFYSFFNKELLLSLGIIPTESLLKAIFQNCTYMPWEKFEDTECLHQLNVPIGVLSNFNNNLPELLSRLFGNIFTNIIVSEEAKIRKPDPAFFQYAINQLSLVPDEILYIGDSIKLDIIPARQIGLRTLLIDREEMYKTGNVPLIRMLSDINDQL